MVLYLVNKIIYEHVSQHSNSTIRILQSSYRAATEKFIIQIEQDERFQQLPKAKRTLLAQHLANELALEDKPLDNFNIATLPKANISAAIEAIEKIETV